MSKINSKLKWILVIIVIILGITLFFYAKQIGPNNNYNNCLSNLGNGTIGNSKTIQISNNGTLENFSGIYIQSNNGGNIYMVTTYGNIYQIELKNNTIINTRNFRFTFPYVYSATLSSNNKFLYVSDYYEGQGHYAQSCDIFYFNNGTLFGKTVAP
jgi:hypothetical protein